MLKTITALMLGATLVAGQAIAQNSVATARVGDRIGSTSDAASDFAGIPLPVLLVGTIIAVGAYQAMNDSPDSN